MSDRYFVNYKVDFIKGFDKKEDLEFLDVKVHDVTTRYYYHIEDKYIKSASDNVLLNLKYRIDSELKSRGLILD